MMVLVTAGMVHPFRRNGAWRPRAWCSWLPCGESLGDALALAHGFALNLDGIGVVDNPVTDGIGQGWIVQVLVPLVGVILRTEDGGRPPCSGRLPVPMNPVALPP